MRFCSNGFYFGCVRFCWNFCINITYKGYDEEGKRGN
ncbi:helix-turn-helix domain-containing protein [Staphylococcus haemolyticus]|nr:helix-turn-helix domain-containing protein [Staphylococcus haemolyticus]MCC3722230.1 helix-turn-helix domain-containing protein [Staphylococcus haemolyticus]